MDTFLISMIKRGKNKLDNFHILEYGKANSL